VIPAVERVLEKAQKSAGEASGKKNTRPDCNVLKVVGRKQPLVWEMPDRCPCCGSELERRGAHHFCPNRDCPDRLVGRLAHFAGKAGLDIDGLGEKTLRLVFNKGLVRQISDIFTADWKRMEGEDGFGEKRITNIINGIEAAKSKSFTQFLAALGFESLGPSLAGDLVKAGYTSVHAIRERAGAGDWEAFAAIPGLAEITARQIVSEFSDTKNLAELDALARAGVCMEVSTAETDSRPACAQIMRGERWCVTGSFAHYSPRELAMEEVKRRGGEVVSGVSSKTTHLLAGSGAGSKLRKAQDLGVCVVSEEEFLQRIRQAD
jgi:DNA ligase (NAD+)